MQAPWRGAAGPSRPMSFAIVLGFVALTCTKDRVTAPESQLGAIQIIAGNEQFGETSAPLRDTIVAVVLDTAGHPMRGVRTEWLALDGGSVAQLSAESGDDGRVYALWTLGPDTTAHEAVIKADRFTPATVIATPALPAPPIGQLRLTDISTYDGSNQTVHPDFAIAGDDWPAPRRYLAITPYPNSNRYIENPSFYEGFRAVRWSVPPGASNPLDTSIPPSHMSDPDVVFDPVAQEFRLYYREVTGENVVWMRRSADAVNWSDREMVARALANQLISPSVVRRSATEWLMWSVRATNGCVETETAVDLRRSTDGVHWSAPEPTNLARAGMLPWHVEVQWMEDLGEYWALFNNKVDATCNTPTLHLATSRDGIDWHTYPTPVLTRGAIPEFEDIVYRSTFYYNPANGVVSFWFSGARYDDIEYVWRTAVQRRNRADLIAELSQTPRSALRAARRVPPLIDPP